MAIVASGDAELDLPAVGVRERRRRDTWRALQRAAIELVDRHGLDGVTVEDIAAHAGLSRRTFFNHFPTKAAALFDPHPDDADRMAALLERAVSAPAESTWAALAEVCVAFVAGHEDVIAVRRRLVAESPELEQYHRTAHHHVEVALQAWTRGRPDVPDDFAAALVAQLAAGILVAAFHSWQPADDPGLLPALVRRGFDATRVVTD